MQDIPETKPDIKEMIGGFVRNPNFILVICGLVASFSSLMLVSFLALGWLDITGSTATGTDIWLGRTILDFSTADAEKSGLGAVRFIDRLLIVVPFGAITLITLAGMVITSRMPTVQGFLSMVAVALFLFFFPFFWQSLSTNNWQSDLSEQQWDELEATYEDYYSTGEQKLFGFLVSATSIIGLALYVADKRGLFEPTERYDTVEALPAPSQDDPLTEPDDF